MKVIVTSMPIPGHLNPLLSIARILVADGHEVVGFNASAFASRFTKTGAQFRPFPAAIDQDMSDVNALFPERNNVAPGPERMLYDFNNIFIRPIADQYAALRSLLQDFPADAIVSDVAFFGTLPMLLGPRQDRPAIAHCGSTPFLLSRDDGAPFGPGLPLATTDEERRKYREIHADISRQVLDPVQQSADRVLATLGRGPLPAPLMDAATILPDLYFQPSVPGFEYPRRKLPPTIKFVGALPQPTKQAPLPDWADEIDGSRRVVLVTQGTVSNTDTTELIQPTLAALADRPDVLVVVTTGGRPVDAVPGRLPANARVAQFLPFEWLMPRLDMLVTNGGYGTVSQAVSIGIPLVVAGISEDKAEVGAHVAWRGIGINLATNTPTVPALRAAIDAVLQDNQYRANGKTLAQEYAQYDANVGVPRLLEATVRSAVVAGSAA